MDLVESAISLNGLKALKNKNKNHWKPQTLC